ncbi:MAG: HIT domain-containing protein [Rickettsiales bacterium]|jgi:diadenosine tetraphosphate (Ap4A) HIT family hydrolase|nr:HIT domain-containing protein [Rickettsiales bacterium]
MSYDRNNVFARILRGELPAKKIYETEHSLVFDNIYPKAKLHLLLIPKGEYASFTEFGARATDAEKLDFLSALSHTIADYGLAADGYRLVANTGEAGGQSVPHFHLHLLGGEKLRNEGL